MDLGQTNNDDLQNAINGIVGRENNVNNENSIESAFVAPPIPPTPAIPSIPELNNDLGVPELNMTETPKVDGDLEKTKNEMIKELLPLIDKVELPAEKKFEFYKQIIEKEHNKEIVPAAYRAVKEITDEKNKAEALLYLINETDK